jgi:hypothetical protein
MHYRQAALVSAEGVLRAETYLGISAGEAARDTVQKIVIL